MTLRDETELDVWQLRLGIGRLYASLPRTAPYLDPAELREMARLLNETAAQAEASNRRVA